ncbi:cytotoxic T-lymphocyte protein 4-like [Lepisosteus oculatus]|uniref:cytotoxic T-lymphocyte protein 4-like n=1 Tax=Lepisosteus oculatus TaxID=7918 RepID=UPI00073FB965|nr:PREDICTED: cytotoxic T-lymphocyte protein 4-like [Lepisosteus oculatus]
MFHLLKLMFIPGIIGELRMVATDSQITARQHPQKITSFPGGSVAFICEFNYVVANPLVIDVSWHHQSDVHQYTFAKDNARLVQYSSNIHLHGNFSKGFSVLVIEDIQPNYTGTYFCEVLLIQPPPVKVTGKGTVLKVYDKEECKDQKSYWWNYIFIALSATSCTLLFAVMFMLVRKCLGRAKHITNKEQRKSEKKMEPIATISQEYEDMTFLRSQPAC